MDIILGDRTDDPPQRNKGTRPQHWLSDRDSRFVCCLLARSRQVGSGALGIACLRDSEQHNLPWMVVPLNP